MVDFGGWDMPVNYGSQIEEHHAVRREAGVFDVSHMCVIDARGPRVREFFSKLIANDVAKLKVSGKALYSCMLNEAGGVIDDLIVYFLDESFFRVVVNAGTRDKDLDWMRGIAPQFGVTLTERTDLAMLAVQGPKARDIVAGLLPAEHQATALALEAFFGKSIPMSRAATGSSRAPVTRAKTVSKSCCPPAKRRTCGPNSIAWASSPRASARATRCASRRR